MATINRAGTPWTRYQDQQLLELRDEHELSWAEISEVMGRAVVSVIAQYRKVTMRAGSGKAARKRAYRAGYDARRAGQGKYAPADLSWSLQMSWCAGWHDRDIEVTRGMVLGGSYG